MDQSAYHDALARELSGAFLTAPWTVDSIAEAGAACLDRWPPWMVALAMTVVALHRIPPVERHWDLTDEIRAFLERHPDPDRPVILRLIEPQNLPPDPLAPIEHSWPVARVASIGDLAERLELSSGQLAWLADVRGLERSVTQERLRNYRYQSRPRSSGLPRIIEAPKARLKEVQRWILAEILDHVPAHDAAHGFTRGRSAVTHARLHTGREAVLRLDLRDFFASVPAGRIYGVWRSLGYPAPVAHMLTGLSTNVVPAGVWEIVSGATSPHAVSERFHLGRQLATPHLPQGAPTSPALANLAAFGLDRRLRGLADASGLRYSRYADDLTFSGSERLHPRHRTFEALVTRIIRSEGFAPNARKSTLQSSGGRQTVCGVVVNAHTNLRRRDYDRLKATLHNVAARGPDGENREGVADFRAHLLGRVSWAETLNPERGSKLRAMFDAISWS